MEHRSPIALYQEESLFCKPALLPCTPRAVQGGGVAMAMPYSPVSSYPLLLLVRAGFIHITA